MVKIEVDCEILKGLGILPNSFILARCIAEKDEETFNWFCELMGEDTVIFYLYKLYQKDYLNKDPEVDFNYVFDFNTLTTSLFGKVSNNEQFDKFFETFYNLFPKVKNGGGLLIRSGESEVKKKLKTFVTKHGKKYSFELILKAVQNYINRYNNNYSYMKTCGYFISKDSTSVLEAECEQLLANPNEIVLENQSSSNMRTI